MQCGLSVVSWIAREDYKSWIISFVAMTMERRAMG